MKFSCTVTSLSSFNPIRSWRRGSTHKGSICPEVKIRCANSSQVAVCSALPAGLALLLACRGRERAQSQRWRGGEPRRRASEVGRRAKDGAQLHRERREENAIASLVRVAHHEKSYLRKKDREIRRRRRSPWFGCRSRSVTTSTEREGGNQL